MSRFLTPALIPIAVGAFVGTVLAVTLMDTQPAILGWLFGAGTGLMGGAFLAAISSGDAIIGGGRPPRRGGVSSAPWLDPTDDERSS